MSAARHLILVCALCAHTHHNTVIDLTAPSPRPYGTWGEPVAVRTRHKGGGLVDALMPPCVCVQCLCQLLQRKLFDGASAAMLDLGLPAVLLGATPATPADRQRLGEYVVDVSAVMRALSAFSPEDGRAQVDAHLARGHAAACDLVRQYGLEAPLQPGGAAWRS